MGDKIKAPLVIAVAPDHTRGIVLFAAMAAWMLFVSVMLVYLALAPRRVAAMPQLQIPACPACPACPASISHAECR